MLVWAVWCYPDTCLELLKVIWSWAVFPDVLALDVPTISSISLTQSKRLRTLRHGLKMSLDINLLDYARIEGGNTLLTPLRLVSRLMVSLTIRRLLVRRNKMVELKDGIALSWRRPWLCYTMLVCLTVSGNWL